MSPSDRTVVIYEDKLSKDARSPNNYLPHLFILHCLADKMGQITNVWNLAPYFKPIPMNGIGNIKNVFLNKREMYRPHGEHLLFVADADRVPEHFGISRQETSCMCHEILCMIPEKERENNVQFYLLVDNLESIVTAAAHVLHDELPEKSHLARDRILGKLLEPRLSEQRKEIVATVPMLPNIIDHLFQRLNGASRG